jgi:hypothetical protein
MNLLSSLLRQLLVTQGDINRCAISSSSVSLRALNIWSMSSCTAAYRKFLILSKRSCQNKKKISSPGGCERVSAINNSVIVHFNYFWNFPVFSG